MDKGATMEKNVSDFMEVCAEMKARVSYDRFMCGAEYVLCERKIESPIEQILWLSLDFLIEANDLNVSVIPQYKIDNYRTDFKIELVNDGKAIKSVLVECDSQKFHERTEKERRYEKTRDRYFKMKGMEILHYTGSEIIEDPFKVGIEILKYLLPGDPLTTDGRLYESSGKTIKL